MIAVEISGLSFAYLQGTPLATPALHSISLQVQQQEIVALLGKTGAGKTTLLQFCNGLLQPRKPGVVRSLGIDTATGGRPLRELRLRAALLLQRAESQLIERFVGDDVAFGLRQMGMPLEEIRERARWAMEAVGLPFEKFKDRRTFNLSGGEMKKVALAGVLATRPELILLDEPTAGLDPESRDGLLALIRRLREEGATVIVATTNIEDVPLIADRMLVLNQGRLVGEIAAQDMWQRGDFLRENELDLPEIGLIVEMLRERGMAISPQTLDINSVAEEICKILPTSDT